MEYDTTVEESALFNKNILHLKKKSKDKTILRLSFFPEKFKLVLKQFQRN